MHVCVQAFCMFSTLWHSPKGPCCRPLTLSLEEDLNTIVTCMRMLGRCCQCSSTFCSERRLSKNWNDASACFDIMTLAQLVEGLVNQAVDNLGNNQLTSINVLNTTFAYTIFMRADIAISEGAQIHLWAPLIVKGTPVKRRMPPAGSA